MRVRCHVQASVVTITSMPLPSVLDEIDRLFDELIRRRWGTAPRQLVPAEVRPVEDGWIIELPVAGLHAEDLKVEVHERRLTVSGHRSRAHEHQHERVWSRMQQETSFQRTITLPAEADPDALEAKLEGGTLSVHVRRRKR